LFTGPYQFIYLDIGDWNYLKNKSYPYGLLEFNISSLTKLFNFMSFISYNL